MPLSTTIVSLITFSFFLSADNGMPRIEKKSYMLTQLSNIAVRHITQVGKYFLELREYSAFNESLKMYAHCKSYFLQAQQLL